MKIPTAPKDIKSIRELLTDISTQLCSRADSLDEPLKSHFLGLKKSYDDAIAALPPTDAVPAALEANHHLSGLYSCLYSANAMTSMLGSAMDSMTKKNAETIAQALNSAVDAKLQERIKAGEIILKTEVDGLVSTAITARTATGDLVPKETVTQLCSVAKETGLKEGEKKVRDEAAAEGQRKAKITERKATLQTLGLPVPDATMEHLLSGTDDEFKAKQETAKNRIAALQQKGVAITANSRVAMNAWLDEPQYKVIEALILDNVASPDPCLAPPRSSSAPPKVMLV